MRRIVPLVLFGLASFAIVARPQLSSDPYGSLPDPRVIAALKTLHAKPGRTDLTPQDGRCLYDLILRNDLKAALEISTSGGASSLWIGLALRQTGGNLRAIGAAGADTRRLRQNYRISGLQDRIDLVAGNPYTVIPTLEGPFDFVFLDARKQEYDALLEIILPKVRAGGIIAAHDVNHRREELAAFIRAITGDPNLQTEILPGSGAGMSISRKIR